MCCMILASHFFCVNQDIHESIAQEYNLVIKKNNFFYSKNKIKFDGNTCLLLFAVACIH
jgi:hypothetical protein